LAASASPRKRGVLPRKSLSAKGGGIDRANQKALPNGL
jgi:hypothetical protein